MNSVFKQKVPFSPPAAGAEKLFKEYICGTAADFSRATLQHNLSELNKSKQYIFGKRQLDSKMNCR